MTKKPILLRLDQSDLSDLKKMSEEAKLDNVQQLLRQMIRREIHLFHNRQAVKILQEGQK